MPCSDKYSVYLCITDIDNNRYLKESFTKLIATNLQSGCNAVATLNPTLKPKSQRWIKRKIQR